MKPPFSQAQWNDFARKFPYGTSVHGTVAFTAQFGVFVQVDEFLHVKALLPVTDLAGVGDEPFRPPVYPDDYPSLGSRIEARVLFWPESPGEVRLTQLGCN